MMVLALTALFATIALASIAVLADSSLRAARAVRRLRAELRMIDSEPVMTPRVRPALVLVSRADGPRRPAPSLAGLRAAA